MFIKNINISLPVLVGIYIEGFGVLVETIATLGVGVITIQMIVWNSSNSNDKHRCLTNSSCGCDCCFSGNGSKNDSIGTYR